MNSNDCNIARDLMPLVIDQVASEESRMLVEAHMVGCEPCAQVYADMQVKTPEQGDAAEDTSFAAAMRQLRRTVGWRRIKVIVLCTVIALVMLVAGYKGYVFFTIEYHRDMPLEWYNLVLSRTKDGEGLVTVDYREGYNGGLGIETDRQSGIVYINNDCPLLPVKAEYILKNPKYTSSACVRWRDSIGFVFDESPSEGITSDMVVNEIRMGRKENYIILYRHGDNVPLCSEELETYLQLQEKYVDAWETINDINQDRSSFDESIVPEWK